MQIRTRLDEVLDGLDNVALLRIYDLAKVYQSSGQLQARKPEIMQGDTVRLSNYLQAEKALAEVEGELSDLLLSMREDRI